MHSCTTLMFTPLIFTALYQSHSISCTDYWHWITVYSIIDCVGCCFTAHIGYYFHIPGNSQNVLQVPLSNLHSFNLITWSESILAVIKRCYQIAASPLKREALGFQSGTLCSSVWTQHRTEDSIGRTVYSQPLTAVCGRSQLCLSVCFQKPKMLHIASLTSRDNRW